MTTGTTATTRRVTKIEETLSPTQLLVRWLTCAQQDYASFSTYAAYVNATANSNPMLRLPAQVATWVRARTRGQAEPFVNREIDRVVTATLGCVALVTETNRAISREQLCDEITLEFLEALAPLVSGVTPGGIADATLHQRWINHLVRLSRETATWELAVSQIADRYFAGHSPLFASEHAHLARVRARVEALITAFLPAHVPRTGQAKRRSLIDQASTTRQAAVDAPQLVEQLRAAARFEVELVFGARPGLIYVQERIAATRLQEDV